MIASLTGAALLALPFVSPLVLADNSKAGESLAACMASHASREDRTLVVNFMLTTLRSSSPIVLSDVMENLVRSEIALAINHCGLLDTSVGANQLKNAHPHYIAFVSDAVLRNIEAQSKN